MHLINLFFLKSKLFWGSRTLILFYCLMTLLIAYISGMAAKNLSIDQIPIAWVDLDNSPYSIKLQARLSDKQALKVFPLNQSEALKKLDQGTVEIVFIVQKGFMSGIQNMDFAKQIHQAVHIQSPNSAFAKEIIAGEVNRFLSNYFALSMIENELLAHDIPSPATLKNEVFQLADTNWDPPLATSSFSWWTERQTASQTDSPSNDYALHGALLFFIMLILLSFGSFVVEENQSSLHSRLLVMKNAVLKNQSINFIVLSMNAFVLTLFLNVALWLFTGIFVLSSIKITLLYLLYIVTIVCFVFLIAHFIRSPFTMRIFAMPISFLLSLGGGCFFQLSEITQTGRTIALFTPQGLVLRAIYQSFYAYILLVFTIAFSLILLGFRFMPMLMNRLSK